MYIVIGFLRPLIFFLQIVKKIIIYKIFYNLIFTKTATTEFFLRTPLPVGIGVFFLKTQEN